MSRRTGLRRWWAERSKKPLVLAGVALMGAVTVAWAPPGAAEDLVVGRATAKPAYQASHDLTRTFENADGTTYDFPTNHVTVSVDQTKNLRGRQRVEIAWSGAQPSAGRASDPYGVNGMNQEYPVVILQCRGVDDASAPASKQLTPETCWTSSVAQRSQLTKSGTESAWMSDLYADDATRERLSGVSPFPTADACPVADIPSYATKLTPFRAKKKNKVYLACDADTMPPEAAVGAAFPPAEVAAFSDAEGSGTIQFEVRSETENESLGCNSDTDCAIVVIPINGLSCAAPSDPETLADQACRKGGRFLPGTSNFVNDAVDQAVSPSLWWAESNWRNRFTIPITFGLPPDTCDVLDPRPPTAFYGSELLAQAALQWAPAYCLDKKRFKYQQNTMSDAAAFNEMEDGGAAAIVSSEHERDGDAPIGYAPTAVTGFGIAYVIDKPGNRGEVGNLRLNARLLAKLMTQSYLGSDLGRDHPGIKENPLGIMADPEFVKLNPGLSQTVQEAGAALLNLSNSSDVIQQLTSYIAEDKDAMAFVDGKPDPWGMKVNPSYKKIDLPRPEWPLLDEYVPETLSECRQKNPGVYFTQLAAPVTTMRKIAEALLDAWPNVQTRCDFDVSTQLFKTGRVDRQGYGSRFMLGVVSLGDAARYGLRSAALETTSKNYVVPSDASLTAAVKLAEQDEKRGPFVIDQGELKKSRTAYPGTMVLYTAARLSGMDQDMADKVAQFIRVSTTEGQKVGSGNGQLPEGFLPIKRTGVTGKLFASAGDVADAVEEQKPLPTEEGSESPTATPTNGAEDGPVDPVAPSDVPTASEPSAPASVVPSATPSDALVTTAPTEAISSDTAGRVLPTLLVIGLLGIALASVLRFVVQAPRRP